VAEPDRRKEKGTIEEVSESESVFERDSLVVIAGMRGVCEEAFRGTM